MTLVVGNLGGSRPALCQVPFGFQRFGKSREVEPKMCLHIFTRNPAPRRVHLPERKVHQLVVLLRSQPFTASASTGIWALDTRG